MLLESCAEEPMQQQSTMSRGNTEKRTKGMSWKRFAAMIVTSTFEMLFLMH
jgi:hypothetical protein